MCLEKYWLKCLKSLMIVWHTYQEFLVGIEVKFNIVCDSIEGKTKFGIIIDPLLLTDVFGCISCCWLPFQDVIRQRRDMVSSRCVIDNTRIRSDIVGIILLLFPIFPEKLEFVRDEFFHVWSKSLSPFFVREKIVQDIKTIFKVRCHNR